MQSSRKALTYRSMFKSKHCACLRHCLQSLNSVLRTQTIEYLAFMEISGSKGWAVNRSRILVFPYSDTPPIANLTLQTLNCRSIWIGSSLRPTGTGERFYIPKHVYIRLVICKPASSRRHSLPVFAAGNSRVLLTKVRWAFVPVSTSNMTEASADLSMMPDTVCEGPFTPSISRGLVADGMSCPKGLEQAKSQSTIAPIGRTENCPTRRQRGLSRVYEGAEEHGACLCTKSSNSNRRRRLLGLQAHRTRSTSSDVYTLRVLQGKRSQNVGVWFFFQHVLRWYARSQCLIIFLFISSFLYAA